MARVANLDKNPRVAHYSVSGESYKLYKVTLNGTFYRKVYRGDAVNCYIHGEERIKALQEQIAKLESRLPEEFAITNCRVDSSTLSGAHDYIDKLLTLEGWHQYRAGMISAIQDEIKQEEERIKERDREDRANSVYPNMDHDWMNAMFIKTNRMSFFVPSSASIHGVVDHTVKEVAKSNVNVAEWKEKELNRLIQVLAEVHKNIEILEKVNVDEAQKWIDGLKTEAIDYIENGATEK